MLCLKKSATKQNSYKSTHQYQIFKMQEKHTVRYRRIFDFRAIRVSPHSIWISPNCMVVPKIFSSKGSFGTLICESRPRETFGPPDQQRGKDIEDIRDPAIWIERYQASTNHEPLGDWFSAANVLRIRRLVSDWLQLSDKFPASPII